ncbi:MAG: CidA/LrgA family protein [Firmicutes bacterium]|nr:CidA/LrgA family protein [Bacillota bacterium]
MRDLAILLAFAAGGQWVADRLPWSPPGTVWGLVLLAAALKVGWVRMGWVEQGAEFLLGWLSLFFIPLVVNGIDVLGAMGWRAIELLAILAVSTTLGLIAAGWVAEGGLGVSPRRAAGEGELGHGR